MRIHELILEHAPPGLDTLPPAPGTAPIPVGTVRLYHQTSEEALRSIAQHGLQLKHARGIEGPRAIYASEHGFYGKPESRPTLEFFVTRDNWHDPFVLQDVMPEQMLALHLPWHRQARYVESHPSVKEQVLAGEHDDLTGDYKLAVDYIKTKYNRA